MSSKRPPSGGWQKKREAEKRKLAEVANDPSQRKLFFSAPSPPTKDSFAEPGGNESGQDGLSCSSASGSQLQSGDGCAATMSNNTAGLGAGATVLTDNDAVPRSLLVGSDDGRERGGADGDGLAPLFRQTASGNTATAVTVGVEMEGGGDADLDLTSTLRRNVIDGAVPECGASSDVSTDLDETNNNVVDKDRCAQDAIFFLPPAENASVRVKKAFLEHHPIQPSSGLPFNKERVFTIKRGSVTVKRKWLSYCASTSSLYCTTCMCFDSRSDSPFVTSGVKAVGRKDIYQILDRHEKSSNHSNAVNAQILALADKDIGNLINEDLAALKTKETEKKRAIVSRIIDILLYIGRQGLAFRGRNEGISDINENSPNHGNFLELAKLLAEYDPVLKEHIKNCIEIARRRKAAAPGKKQGRGNLITFMSKEFLNKVITILGESIQEIAVANVKAAGIFSIEIDSTTDVAALDQLTVVVRYVSSTGVHETLLTLTISHDGTGLGLHELLKKNLIRLGIDIKNIIACSFDGASNMSGCFKGLQARLKQDNPDLIYTHCAGHCLNLVLSSCSESCNVVKTFFGLVESAAVFMSDSHKRMDAWTKIVKGRNVGNRKLQRLRKWGKTRWWSRPASIKSMIDTDGKSTTKFVDFLLCMEEIRTSSLFDSKTNFAATNFRDNWCKFENVLVAFIMLAIFQHSTPVSEALQSPSIDYLVTFTLVDGLLKKLELMRDQFDLIEARTREYVKQVNEELEREEVDFRVEDRYVVTRRTRDFSSGSAPSGDEEQIRAAATFRVDVFYCIIDHAIQGLRNRFTPNEGLLRDCALLDPKRFKDPLFFNNGSLVAEDALSTVVNLTKVDHAAARVELEGFAMCYESLVTSHSSKEREGDEDVEDELSEILGLADEGEDDEYLSVPEQEKSEAPRAKCEACHRCLACALHKFLYHPCLQSAYPNLFALYKFVLTIPTTQVSCERMFSKLKIIKTRLRNLLSQDLLEPLLFISVERAAALALDKKTLIYKIARTSPLLESLLL